ncbi:hypothetical protein G9C85_06220 [Halorubellus sp. JP-L1]|uniref:hypothetical protein n=1 Tax=Halorubellus sp. JP-L1 TaxID=2715753 RepID=UPI00140BCF0C|nr:hypothetical protein [Halorubellus sp. JP-L1]NHN41232.1 hypothetical protein [Halorubellus sp. JP-L1]
MQLLHELDFISTYDRTNPSAQTLVDDYREYQDYRTEHPDESPYQISKALDQPRSRLREWVNGSKPDAVTALDEMHERGWMADMPSPETRALNHLAARAIAAGYVVANDYAPAFTDKKEDRAEIQAHLDTLGFESRIQDYDSTGTEIRPGGNAQLLGRALVAAGVPRGRDETQLLDLPEYLNFATTSMRRDFLGVWLLTRSVELENDGPWAVRVELKQSRAASFIGDLAALFEAEAGRSTVERAGRHIYLTPTAMNRLVEGQ